MIDYSFSYPMQWPQGQLRTPGHKRISSQFNVTAEKALQEMLHQIELMGASDLVMSTAMRTRRDGGIYARDLGGRVSDPGIAVYFTRKGVQTCFACDQYHEMWENMRGIGKTIEALRGIERWGGSTQMEQAFSGFAALPPPRSWVEVLFGKDGVQLGARASAEDIKIRHRELVRRYHAEPARLKEINVARDQALEYLKCPTD